MKRKKVPVLSATCCEKDMPPTYYSIIFPEHSLDMPLRENVPYSIWNKIICVRDNLYEIW
jgi:hypothetical protein